MTGNRLRKPLVQEVADALVRQIGDGTIGGDGWLPAERALAADIGVSRNVLREAIKRLESQGVVEARHGVGVRVVNNPYKPIAESVANVVPDLKERLLQLTQIRLIVEPEIARLAAQNATRELIENLSAAQDALAGSKDPEEAAEHDLAFHRHLVNATGNRTLVLILDSLAEIGRASRQNTLATYGIERAHSQHAAILRCIVAGDPDAAAEAMRENLKVTESDIAKLGDRKEA